MRNGILAAMMTLVATAGLALSDEPINLVDALARFQADPLTTFQAPPPTPTENTAAPAAFQQESPSPGNRFWGSAEFLMWWMKDGSSPPLVTTGPPASGGVLGAPGTTTLFGGNLDNGALPGARFTLGTWLDCNHKIGIEANYFLLEDGSDDFFASSSGAIVLSRPFFNVLTGMQDREIVAFPGSVAGNVGVDSDSTLQGGELNMLCNKCCQCDCCGTSGYRLDLLAGVRYLELNERLAIGENLLFLDTAPEPFEPGSAISVLDEFETRNRFYGAQIGARARWWQGRWDVNLEGKLALGYTHQEVHVNGTTVFTDPAGGQIRRRGGFLALPTNMGSRSHDEFTVVPEVGLKVGYQLTRSLRLFAGYSFMYWSSVVRPGDQIDLGINPTQLPSSTGPGILVGPARPAVLFRDTDFWAQGVSMGMEFRW